MENQIIEQLTAATSKSCETMKSLGDINSSAFRKINDLQFDFISMSMESGIEQAKALSSKDSITDVFAASSEFASDYNEKLMGITRQTVEIFSDSRDEVTKLIEKAIASKAAPVKKLTEAKATAAKSAAKKSAKKAA